MRFFNLLFLLIVAFNLSAQAPERGLVAHFTFDDHIRDNRNNLNVTYTTKPQRTADRFGNSCGAIRLDGKDQSISIDSFWPGSTFSVCVWYKPEKTNRNEAELLLLSQAAAGDESSGSLLNVKYAQSFFDASSRVHFSTSQNFDDRTYQSHRTEFGQWNFFALACDGDWAYAYLNGKLIGQIMITKSVKNNGQPLMIGRDAIVPRFFQGSLDDLRLYDRALLPAEVSAVYSDNSSGKSSDNFTIKTSENLKVSNDKGKCYAALKFFPPTVNLSCGGYEIKQVSGIPSGSLFNVGKTYNRFQATDENGRIVTATFEVEVVDAEDPELKCPADVYIKAPAGARVMPVRYPGVIAGDNCGIRSIEKTKGLASGAYFPIGTTEIRYQASDSAGNMSECAFKVIVETEQPVVSPPAAVNAQNEEVVKPVAASQPPKTDSLAEPASRPEKTPAAVDAVKQPAATADSKTVSGQVKQANTTANNAIPPKAKIDSSASAALPAKEANPVKPAPAATQKEQPSAIPLPASSLSKTEPAPPSSAKATAGVTVSDVKPKTTSKVEVFGDGSAPKGKIIFPSDMTKPSEPGKCGAVVTYKAPKTENGREVAVQQSAGKPSGSFFPVGVTENSFYTADQSGATEYFFNVVVTDNEPPVLKKCPTDTVVKVPYGRRGVTFNYELPVIKDNCKSDTIKVVKGSKPGCFLPLGVHPFILEVSDASGNQTQCGFEVVVMEDAEPSVVNAPKQLAKHLNLGADSINYEHNVAVNNCFLTILIYDDGEEDNDSVSIIFNGSVIVNRDMIRLKENGAIKRELVLGSNMQNYLVAKAWNTGRYGSNTLRIDVYEGAIENDKRDLKNKKPVISKILHSRPGIAGGVLLNCRQ